jgi:2-phospho-L-lactate guanylyltransferase
MAHAVVPLKDLVQAKTRLSGLLAPSERRALAQAMAEDVLAVLAAHPEIESVSLVSDDPAAHLLASQYGVRHWAESELGCRGLNEVIDSACGRLLGRGEAPLLVLHADLPVLSPADITTVLAARRQIDGLVVGSDRHGSGTNVLCFDSAAVPAFCFGLDSCNRHLAAARSGGFPAIVVSSPGIGLDVDEPPDLVVLMDRLQRSARGHTAALLHDTELGVRIVLALDSMESRKLPRDENEVG